MRKSFKAGILAAGLLALFALPSRAEEGESGALAKALPEASVSLEQGLKVGASAGKPISAKFELDDGALQLSIYTLSGDTFSEVIVDHKVGTIKKTEPITSGDDLKDAQNQSAAMAKASVPLVNAVAAALRTAEGYRAISVTPMLAQGHPAAEIILMKGQDVKKNTQNLD
jgi:hypothetical protein